MSTTTLLVEMLIAGAMADVWVFLIVWKIAPFDLTILTASIAGVAELLIFPFIAVTYGLGVAVNSAAEKLIKSTCDKKIRDPIYDDVTKEIGGERERISGLVFHKGREKVIEDLRHGLHLIRVARSSALNFLMIAITLLLYWQDHELIVLIGSLFSVVIAVLAYFEGRSRFRRNHERTVREYREIRREESSQGKSGNTPDQAQKCG